MATHLPKKPLQIRRLVGRARKVPEHFVQLQLLGGLFLTVAVLSLLLTSDLKAISGNNVAATISSASQAVDANSGVDGCGARNTGFAAGIAHASAR